jgi:Zn-finger nucleic acid-binding protein
MAQDKILGVTVHRCSDSGGMWLDAGEMKRLVGSLLQSGGGDLTAIFSLLAPKS